MGKCTRKSELVVGLLKKLLNLCMIILMERLSRYEIFTILTTFYISVKKENDSIRKLILAFFYADVNFDINLIILRIFSFYKRKTA